ncbi:MAG: chorismate mutase, partial [Actinomycetota bacterium]
VDAELARVLNERAGLTAAIQRYKAVPGQAGRDRDREAEIAALMAEQAPNLGPERIAQIMDVVISASLEAAESD